MTKVDYHIEDGVDLYGNDFDFFATIEASYDKDNLKIIRLEGHAGNDVYIIKDGDEITITSDEKISNVNISTGGYIGNDHFDTDLKNDLTGKTITVNTETDAVSVGTNDGINGVVIGAGIGIVIVAIIVIAVGITKRRRQNKKS